VASHRSDSDEPFAQLVVQDNKKHAGDQLGPYQILEPLGAGGMGEVQQENPELASALLVQFLRDYAKS